MSNPYAGTQLWARWFSQVMGWPVTQGVANAADGPVCCDFCGSDQTRDEAWPTDHGFTSVVRNMTLESDYCFGCGVLICEDCAEKTETWGPHQQADHRP